MWHPQTKEAVLREVRIRQWRALIWELTKIYAKKSLKRLFYLTQLVWEWFKEKSSKTAFELEVNQQISRRYDKLLQLGQRTYSLYQSGNFSWQVLEPLCIEINQIDEQLNKTHKAFMQVVVDKPDQYISVTGSQ